jgi:hypothetical protein
MIYMIGLLLAAGPPPGSPNAREFWLGLNGTRLTVTQHADGSAVLRAVDRGGSATCRPDGAAEWVEIRDLFSDIAGTWQTQPTLRFGPVRGHGGFGCELMAYTVGGRVFVEVAEMTAAGRLGYARVELSPTLASHTIVETSSVQRVETNEDGLRAVKTGLAVAAVLLGRPSPAQAAAIFLAAEVKPSEIEDTTTYYRRVIEAHTDLALLVLTTNAYLYGGYVPRNEDVDAAYRVADLLHDDRPELFIRVLSTLASGTRATNLLVALNNCPEEDPIACLDKVSAP